MLSPDQITAMAQARGDTVYNPNAGQPGNSTDTSAADAYAARVGYQSPDASTTTTNGNPSGFEGLKQDLSTDVAPKLSEMADNTKQVFTGKKSLGSGLVQNAGDLASALGSAGTDVVKSIFKPEIRQAVGDAVGGMANTLVTSQNPAVKAILDNPALTKLTQAVHSFAQANPEQAKDLEGLFNVASVLPVGEGATAAKEAVDSALPSATEKLSTAMTPAVDAATSARDTAIDSVKNIPTGARQAIQEKAATGIDVPGVGKIGGTLGDQAQTSAQRLADTAAPAGMGAAVRVKPVDMYNEFAAQEAKHLGDIKEDPAISLVGNRIGDAFGQVVKQRQAAGKTMSSELEKIGNNTVSTKGALGNLQQELLNNGVRYDALDKRIIPGDASKFSSADNSILEKYTTELQKLGSNPSISKLDAFISRIPNEIESLKSTQNIKFKTNAERIVSKSLNNLRDTLGKSATPEYNAARLQYSSLSNFINEGAGHLGKLTQSGDFAKDASLAKSAVQSVLNNGKKDWLAKLEQLTGYPALDQSVLALQAMKDAGDYKGNSLLDLLTEGSGTPSSPTGIAGKVLGFMGNAATKVVAGSKADQTRAFLKSLEKKGKK